MNKQRAKKVTAVVMIMVLWVMGLAFLESWQQYSSFQAFSGSLTQYTELLEEAEWIDFEDAVRKEFPHSYQKGADFRLIMLRSLSVHLMIKDMAMYRHMNLHTYWIPQKDNSHVLWFSYEGQDIMAISHPMGEKSTFVAFYCLDKPFVINLSKYL